MKELTDSQFYEDLQNEDELGAVIRGHLHIEHALNEILNTQIPHFVYLDKLKLDYEVKVALSVAMGLNKNYEKPLNGIALLRNKYAHRPGFVMTKTDTTNLYKSFASEDREIIQGAFGITNKQHNKEKMQFKALKPIDQFILLAVTVRQILIQARAEW